jgi:ribonuclease R
MDKINSNGLFYKLSNDIKTNFINNDLYYLVLPDDEVTYTRLPNNDVLIESIVSRKPRNTIGIFDSVTGMLRLPLESKIYTNIIDYESNFSNKITICLVNITKDSIIIIKEYGDIKDRVNDLEVCKDFYEKHDIYNEDLYASLNRTATLLEPFYSKPDTVRLTHLDTFNIDPTNSLDFDDAISIDTANRILYVHIVDIDTHLKHYEEHQERAFRLGSTLYLDEGILNIFNDYLANNIFSLVKGEDRPVITVEIHLDIQGDIIKHETYSSVIRIKTRYDYESANRELGNGNQQLVFLDNLLKSPKWKYSKLDIPKRIMKLNNGSIEDIEIYNTNRVNKIIEAVMVMTNRLITEDLVGIVPERYHPISNGINNISEESVSGLEAFTLLKKYKLAKYTTLEKGHFALDIPHYTHFTSPIRRSVDILVHKILGGTLYNNEELERLLEHLNRRDILNTKAVNFYEKLKLFSYFETKKPEYSFTITNIVKHGIHIYIEAIAYYEFIHISKILPNVRWNYIDGELVSDVRTLKKGDVGNIQFKTINLFKMSIDRSVIRFKNNLTKNDIFTS